MPPVSGHNNMAAASAGLCSWNVDEGGREMRTVAKWLLLVVVVLAVLSVLGLVYEYYYGYRGDSYVHWLTVDLDCALKSEQVVRRLEGAPDIDTYAKVLIETIEKTFDPTGSRHPYSEGYPGERENVFYVLCRAYNGPLEEVVRSGRFQSPPSVRFYPGRLMRGERPVYKD